MSSVDVDAFHPDRVAVAGLSARMRTFNEAGVLSAADIHTAARLARLTGCTDDLAILAAAFAVRAPRFGHVFAQLDELADTVTDEDGRNADLDPAVWPQDVEAWVTAVATSPLVVADPAAGMAAPLHLDGRRLYLDRYWRYEHRVAAAIRDRGGVSPGAVHLSEAGERAIDGLFGDNAAQQAAARAALGRRLAVVAGGPGTGKTRVIAQTVAIAASHSTRRDGRPLRVAIAAPTGKAAARLGEEMRQVAPQLPPELVNGDLLGGLAPTTLHRLLGWRPNRTRFRHDRTNPLPFDLVVVDEVSMVSLAMLASVFGALAHDAHLVLVGDPDQLAAVEAGTVLGDLINSSIGWSKDQVVTLTQGYRFDDQIKQFATAIRNGDHDMAMDCLSRNTEDLVDSPLTLIEPDRPGEWPSGAGVLAPVKAMIVDHARAVTRLAAAGQASQALDAALRVKVVCAHRRGPEGVAVWNSAIEGWVHDLPSYRRPQWYAGRPVIITRNDYDLDVYNGDIGVVVSGADDSLRVVVDGRDGAPIEHRRLPDSQTVHAMTVHKSQGSQFDRVIVVLPSERSPVLTRELLYTAITRAKKGVTIVGSPEVMADAINRPVARASALPERLGRQAD